MVYQCPPLAEKAEKSGRKEVEDKLVLFLRTVIWIRTGGDRMTENKESILRKVLFNLEKHVYISEKWLNVWDVNPQKTRWMGLLKYNFNNSALHMPNLDFFLCEDITMAIKKYFLSDFYLRFTRANLKENVVT